eukprot:50516_1
MSSSEKKRKRRKTFALKEEAHIDVETLTKIAKERQKCGLIVSNAAELPLWMSDDELSKNILIKRERPPIFSESPLKGTFTDGFAMYSTFLDVENTEVRFAVNMNGREFMNSLTSLFKETENGVNDFFIYYSGIGKSFNGDWLCYDEEDDKLNIIPLNLIVKKWKARPAANKNQYLLLVADTNYSGIWVSKAKDMKVLQRHNILVQSAVGRDEPSLEMTIGEIKPPCWVSQIICGKFTHNWLEIACSPFYNIEDAVIAMKGSFVVLNKQIVWDSNEEYYAESDHPMSNLNGPNDEKTMVVIPAFGYHADAMIDIDEEIDAVLAEINKDDEEKKQPETVALKKGGNHLKVKRRTSHLPQPSVRRLNLLQGVVGGLKLKKHRKMKSRHVSTYSRGFIFTKVLTDIRHMVMGSDDEEYDDITKENNTDWIQE